MIFHLPLSCTSECPDAENKDRTHHQTGMVQETLYKSNSIKSYPYASDRDVEMDIFHHGNYLGTGYLPGSYAKFPLHIVKVEDAKGSLLQHERR